MWPIRHFETQSAISEDSNNPLMWDSSDGPYGVERLHISARRSITALALVVHLFSRKFSICHLCTEFTWTFATRTLFSSYAAWYLKPTGIKVSKFYLLTPESLSTLVFRNSLCLSLSPSSFSSDPHGYVLRGSNWRRFLLSHHYSSDI